MDNVLNGWTLKLIQDLTYMKMLNNTIRLNATSLKPSTLHQTVFCVCQTIQVLQKDTCECYLRVGCSSVKDFLFSSKLKEDFIKNECE